MASRRLRSLAPTESAPVAPRTGPSPGGTAPAASTPAKPGVPGGKPGSPSAKPGDGTPIIPVPIGDEDGSPTQLVTDALYSRLVSIKGEGSALLGEHSKTRAYAVGISPDNGSISLANDQRQYRMIADGSKGDFWAFNQVQTRRVAANIVDLAWLAYTRADGTPRVVPIWFLFDGEVITMCSPPRAPKLHVLADQPDVAITIDDERARPYRALLIRGRARVEMLGALAPEYEAAARRYLGDEQAEAWVAPLRGLPMARISVRPTWVCVLDFVTRFPSALSA